MAVYAYRYAIRWVWLVNELVVAFALSTHTSVISGEIRPREQLVCFQVSGL